MNRIEIEIGISSEYEIEIESKLKSKSKSKCSLSSLARLLDWSAELAELGGSAAQPLTDGQASGRHVGAEGTK